MACEICGKNACTRSFHSLEEQADFDKQIENVKDSIKNQLLRGLKRLTDYYDQEKEENCVSYSDVESLIEDILW